MAKPKSEMRQVNYNGYTVYEISKGKWRIGYTAGRGGYYHGSSASLADAQAIVDRMIDEAIEEREKRSEE